MASEEPTRYPLTVLEGPRICGSGKNRGNEQYLIQWVEPKPNGQPYKPEWLNTEDIGEADIAAFHDKSSDDEDAEGSVVGEDPMVIDHPAPLAPRPRFPQSLPVTHPMPCQDTAHKWGARFIVHNREAIPCKSTKHVSPYYVCTGCVGGDLAHCCNLAQRTHIFRDGGCHTICSDCANALGEAEGLNATPIEYNACQCQEDEHICVQCHLDNFTERLNRKDGDAGVCFCGRQVDQNLARTCSGCGFLVVKQNWNQ